jgi:putative salt-induced outer membrane protein YdiY
MLGPWGKGGSPGGIGPFLGVFFRLRARGVSLGMVLAQTAVPGALNGQAILNVESLQSWEVEGFHGGFNARLSLSRGNTDLLQTGGTLAAGFKSENHWARAFLGMEWLRKNEEDLVENLYTHLRYNYLFTEEVRSFHFFQIQTNQNLRLKERWLLGSGIRFLALGRPGRQLDLGSGLMYEWETLQDDALGPGEDPESRTVRIPNLVVGSWDPVEGTRLAAVVYYQPALLRLVDYRLSGETGLAVEITETLNLEITFSWRHDSRAPANLEQDDITLKTGINFRFQ